MLSEAAVAVIRVVNPVPQYLILRRAENKDDPWSGHFSLPGGRRDPEDENLLATCIRETEEEIGVRLSTNQLVRKLSKSVAGNLLGNPAHVTPFLFEINLCPDLKLDATEIADSHWVTTEYLMDARNHVQAATLPNDTRLFPSIRLGNGHLWGFTYRVMQDLVGF